MKDLYQILGVGPEASQEELKRAYYVKAKEAHPDSGKRTEIKSFYELSEAYQILSDPEKRRAYDLARKTGKLEKELIQKEPLAPSPEVSKAIHGEPAEFRAREMRRYRRQLFMVALTKVIITAVIAAALGNTLALLLNGHRPLGTFLGLAFGLIWAVNSHFDLESFLPVRAHLLAARWGGRAVQALAALYFIGLFLYHLLRT